MNSPKMDQFNAETQGLLEQAISSVRLSIGGMTCQSCVRNIEGNIKTKPGIVSIKVNLQEKAGYIDYDPNVTDPRQIANEIDDMGFDCVYDGDHDNDDEQIAAKILNSKSLKLTRISVDGMKCQSCVKNIEGNIGKVDGVNKITVDLEEKLATVEYQSDLLNENEIAEMIGDMGFTTQVLGDSEQLVKTDNFIAHNGESDKYCYSKHLFQKYKTKTNGVFFFWFRVQEKFRRSLYLNSSYS